MYNIYRILNTLNDKCYIGQTSGSIFHRFSQHKCPKTKDSIKLHNAFNKYGRDNFIIELLITSDTEASSDDYEIFFIQKYDSINNGYNISTGGVNGGTMRGRLHTEDSKKKMSEVKIGKPSNKKGKPISDNTKNKISLSKTGKRVSVDTEFKPKINYLIAENMRYDFSNGIKQKDIAIKYKVSRRLVNLVINNKIWINETK